MQNLNGKTTEIGSFNKSFSNFHLHNLILTIDLAIILGPLRTKMLKSDFQDKAIYL